MSYSRKSKSRAGLSIKQKDETLVMNGTITSDMLIKERDFYMSNKGARTKSIRDRIVRIESVLVARERILSEMLKKKTKDDGFNPEHIAMIEKEIKDAVPSK